MKEVSVPRGSPDPVGDGFRAALATILELEWDVVARVGEGEEPAGRNASRWLGGLGLGLVRVADPGSFAWPGPWLARLSEPAPAGRFVVMYGVPSAVVWDPGGGASDAGAIAGGFVVAATDIALARPPAPGRPTAAGVVEQIGVAASGGAELRAVEQVRALAGRGLDGDRHALGTGTFPSGVPGSALTLIEAEVCESFAPALAHEEHRRNVVTRGIALNDLVGREFSIGSLRCRGVRLCEPCAVVDRYSPRPILRPLVHRGGLRADILEDGEIRVGDRVAPSEGS